MINSAIDLRNPRLRPAVGGFARDEVLAFLAVAADDYEAAVQALEQLRAEHAEAAERLLEARNHEREVARVLSAAERSAQETLGRAQQVAGGRISAADEKAAGLLRDAGAERERILAEIANVRDRQSRIVTVLETEIAALRQPVLLEKGDAAAVRPGALPVPDSIAAADVPGRAAADAVEAQVTADAGTSDEQPVEALSQEEQVVGAGPSVAPSPGVTEQPELQPERTSTGFAASGDSVSADAARPGQDDRVESIPSDEEPVAVEDASRTRRRRVLVAAGIAALAIMSVAAIPWLRTSHDPAVAVDRPELARERPPVSVRETKTVPVAASTSTGDSPLPHAPESAAATASPKGIAVRLEATSECWLRLTIGSRSEEFLLEAGDVLERTSTTDVVLRTGNAGALIVSVNGRPIPPIGGEGEVVTRRITHPISLP